jgi:hypothetical protein
MGHVIGTRIPGLSLVVCEVHGDSGRMDRPVRRVITRIGNVPGSNGLELLPGRSKVYVVPNMPGTSVLVFPHRSPPAPPPLN